MKTNQTTKEQTTKHKKQHLWFFGGFIIGFYLALFANSIIACFLLILFVHYLNFYFFWQMALQASKTLPFRWRADKDFQYDHNKPDDGNSWAPLDVTSWADSEPIGDVRRRIASSYGSNASKAAEHAPELWECDEDCTPVQRVNIGAAWILRWNSATAEQRLHTYFDNGNPRAFILFTFPPAPPVNGNGRVSFFCLFVCLFVCLLFVCFAVACASVTEPPFCSYYCSLRRTCKARVTDHYRRSSRKRNK